MFNQLQFTLPFLFFSLIFPSFSHLPLTNSQDTLSINLTFSNPGISSMNDCKSSFLSLSSAAHCLVGKGVFLSISVSPSLLPFLASFLFSFCSTPLLCSTFLFPSIFLISIFTFLFRVLPFNCQYIIQPFDANYNPIFGLLNQWNSVGNFPLQLTLILSFLHFSRFFGLGRVDILQRVVGKRVDMDC